MFRLLRLSVAAGALGRPATVFSSSVSVFIWDARAGESAVQIDLRLVS